MMGKFTRVQCDKLSIKFDEKKRRLNKREARERQFVKLFERREWEGACSK